MDYTPQTRQAIKEGFYRSWMSRDAYANESFPVVEAEVIKHKSYMQMNADVAANLANDTPLKEQLDDFKKQSQHTSWKNQFNN
jgi:hypothetical protein